MARIFISCSRQDTGRVHACAYLLRAAGYEVLIDDDLLPAGSDVRNTLAEAIHSADAMGVFPTENDAVSSNVLSE